MGKKKELDIANDDTFLNALNDLDDEMLGQVASRAVTIMNRRRLADEAPKKAELGTVYFRSTNENFSQIYAARINILATMGEVFKSEVVGKEDPKTGELVTTSYVVSTDKPGVFAELANKRASFQTLGLVARGTKNFYVWKP